MRDVRKLPGFKDLLRNTGYVEYLAHLRMVRSLSPDHRRRLRMPVGSADSAWALTSSFRTGMLTHKTEDHHEVWSRNPWTAAAFALVLAIGVASTAGAQQAPAGAQGRGGGPAPAGAQGGGRGGAPYTPAAGAKDLRAVLFNWMWHQGMLKGADERDMVAMLEYQAKGGTIQVDGQPCTLSKFRESTNYQTFSQRIQYTCTRPNKQTVLEHRGGQLAVRVERGHAGRGDRWHERQGCGDAGSRAGAAHSHLGQSAGRGEVRAGRDHGHVEAGCQPGHGDRRRRDEGRQYVSCRSTPRASRS